MKSKTVISGNVKPKYLICAFSVCIYGILLGISASGFEAVRNIAQLSHTKWTIQDGAPSGVSALAQTTDGYLWLGTDAGLFRFDGVKFEKFEPPPGSEQLPFITIQSLFAPSTGGLWIGFQFKGASFLKDGKVVNYSEKDGLPTGTVSGIATDPDGIIWAATNSGLARFENSRWQKIGAEWNFKAKDTNAIFLDRDGTLWVATEDTVIFLPAGEKAFHDTNFHSEGTYGFSQAPDGRIWVAETGTDKSVRPLPQEQNRQAPAPKIEVESAGLLFARDGSLWIAGLGDGIRRLPEPATLGNQTVGRFDEKAEIFTQKKDGLSGDYAWPILEDREGNVWVGTSGGLDRFRPPKFTLSEFPAGSHDFALAATDDGAIWAGTTNQPWMRLKDKVVTFSRVKPQITCAYRDEEGIIWLGGPEGVWRMTGDKIVRVAALPDEAKRQVQAITKDRTGTLWVSVIGTGFFKLTDGIWTRIDNLPEKKRPDAALTAADGRVWLGFNQNKIAVVSGENIEVLSIDNGLQVGNVMALYQGARQKIWVGGDQGLACFDGKEFKTIKAGDGKLFTGISGIVEDNDGNLWLHTISGIFRIPAETIQQVVEDPSRGVQYEFFDFLDGLPGPPTQLRPFPTMIKGVDGRLWFATSNGVVWLDPANIAKNPLPPPVSIQSLKADGKLYEFLSSAELPAGTANIEIDYAGLSLSIPDRVKFRYKLEGTGEDWQDAANRRQAFYNNLGPGHYRFRVIACNNDGVWNESGATLQFSIIPAFYQTNWFLLLCLAAAVYLVWLGYRWRISLIESRLHLQFEDRLAERTRIAQELHDTLLQGFLGVTMRLQAISNFLLAKPEKAHKSLEDVLNQVDSVLEEGRRAIWDIRSSTLNENDLTQAFTLAGKELNEAYPANFSLTTNGESCPLHPLIRDEVYRIGREALTNAFRHSKSTEIEAGIEYSLKNLRIFIRDNGCGISPDFLRSGREGHLGLPGMRESAEKIGAELKIWSRAESGTEVELIVPQHIAFRKKTSGGLFNRLNNLVRRRKPAHARQNEREK